jgi:hypothetical protein
MTELLEPARPNAPLRLIILLVIIVALLGGGGYALYRFVIAPSGEPRPQTAVVQEPEEPTAGQEFLFEDEAMTRWFSLDDRIGFPLNGNTYRLELIDIGRTLTVKIPGGTLDMTLGEDRQLDVNGDGRNDLRILLNDLDTTDVAKRANLSLYKITKASAPEVVGASEGEQSVLSEEGEGALTTAVEAPVAETAGGTITILTADEPSPFRVSISFRGYCLFRYLVDNDIREERFFHKGESFSLDAKNRVQLWISNAGVVRLMVAGRELEVGRPGAVTTKLVRWRRDDVGGRYILEVVASE